MKSTIPSAANANHTQIEEINSACFERLEKQGIPTVESEVIVSTLPGGGLGLRAAVTKKIDPNGVYAVGQYTGFHYPSINHATHHHVPVLTPFQDKRKFNDIVDDKIVKAGDIGLGLASLCNHSCLANAWTRSIIHDDQTIIILLTYGWVIQEKQELCINYGDEYFHTGALSVSMINQGCFFSPQDRLNLKRYLNHIDPYRILSMADQDIVVDINVERLTASSEQDFIGQKILLDLCAIISFSPLINSLINHPDSEFTAEEKAISQQFFKKITKTPVTVGNEAIDFYQSVTFEYDLTKKILSLEGMDTFLLSGQWNTIVSHPMIQANMPLPFEQLNIDFSSSEHREIMNKAIDIIGFIGRVYAFEMTLNNNLTTEVTLSQALKTVISFWTNMEHAISQAINGRDYSGFYTKTMIDLICDISAIHRLDKTIGAHAPKDRGHDNQTNKAFELIKIVVAEISEIMEKCRALVQTISPSELPLEKTTLPSEANPMAKFYQFLKKAFKILPDGNIDTGKVIRLRSIYTPQWIKKGPVREVSMEAHHAYLEKFNSNDRTFGYKSISNEHEKGARADSSLHFFSQPDTMTTTRKTTHKP